MTSFNNASPAYSMTRQVHMLSRFVSRVFSQWSTDDLNAVSQSMALEENRLPRLLRLTITVLSTATFLFIVWAALTPVKELARTEGQVLPSGYNQIVQHLEGGLVREILVHEGDFVQKDQILIELGGAGLEEDFHEQQDLVASLSLEAERLHALLDNRTPNFSGIAGTARQLSEQQRMFETTRASNQSQRAVIDEQIAQKKAMLPRLEQSLESSRRNLEVAREGLDIYTKLSASGLAARTVFLKKQEEFNTTQNETDTISHQIEQAQNELVEFQKRREALTNQQRDMIYTELNKVEATLEQSNQTLKKRNDRVDRLEVRAPVAGYIKGLRVNTIGSVIPAGQTLMEIVPADEQLIVEVRILPQQIGRVAVGQDVQVKIDSYDYVRFGTILGKLDSISAMTFSDEVRRQDYYKGRVRLSHNYAGTVPGTHTILPGMTVDADIVTGEKSVLGYLLKPIHIAMHNALTEQ